MQEEKELKNFVGVFEELNEDEKVIGRVIELGFPMQQDLRMFFRIKNKQFLVLEKTQVFEKPSIKKPKEKPKTLFGNKKEEECYECEEEEEEEDEDEESEIFGDEELDKEDKKDKINLKDKVLLKNKDNKELFEIAQVFDTELIKHFVSSYLKLKKQELV